MSQQNNSAWRSWLVIFLIAAVFLSMYRINPNTSAEKEIALLDFYRAMDEGKLVEPVVRVFDRDEGSTYLSGEMETDKVDDKGTPLVDKDGNPVSEKYRVALVPG